MGVPVLQPPDIFGRCFLRVCIDPARDIVEEEQPSDRGGIPVRFHGAFEGRVSGLDTTVYAVAEVGERAALDVHALRPHLGVMLPTVVPMCVPVAPVMMIRPGAAVGTNGIFGDHEEGGAPTGLHQCGHHP